MHGVSVRISGAWALEQPPAAGPLCVGHVFWEMDTQFEAIMNQSIMDKVAEATGAVPALSLEEAAGLLGRTDVLFVAVSEAEETAQTSDLKGPAQSPRGKTRSPT